ncbi:MAG: hypothetical protein JEZ14_11685 [Marinilabiliaceae bacterium]|nr:hypothetical protein [Marinilabiliaceae bacterium]
MLKQGWIEYPINNQSKVQSGLQQVPFGLQPYTSNSWFCNLPFYIGLEDDYDMGVKWTQTMEHIEIQAAFYKNPNDSAQYKDVIEMAAFGAPYQVAAKGQILSSSISYKIPIKGDLVDQRFCSGVC